MACVERLSPRGGNAGQEKRPEEEDRGHWLRRQALQLVAQLPDNDEEAREILRFADRLIGFVRAPGSA